MAYYVQVQVQGLYMVYVQVQGLCTTRENILKLKKLGFL